MGRVSLSVIALLSMALTGCSSQKLTVDSSFPTSQYFQRDELREFFQASGPSILPEEYVIGVGDHLDILFPLHRDLTAQDLVVRRDGRVSLPYLGDVMAAGLTPMGLDSVLTDMYSGILKQPEISVVVRETPERMVYVMGQVRYQGGVKTNMDISLTQAIALAGGFAPGAKETNVVVIRRVGAKRIIAVEVDVEKILQGKALENDFLLKDYDIVYVPKTRLKSAADVASNLNELLNLPFNLISRGWSIVAAQAAIEFYRRGD